MRAVVIGLVGAVLAVGAAQAGECRPGYAAFVEQANENRAGRLLTVEVTDFSSVTQPTEQGAYSIRSARGSAKGKHYVFELMTAPHMLGSPVSYEDGKANSGASPRWGSSFSEWPWKDGEAIYVTAGPLEGPWRVRCAD